jgi:hypothetical protein
MTRCRRPRVGSAGYRVRLLVSASLKENTCLWMPGQPDVERVPEGQELRLCRGSDEVYSVKELVRCVRCCALHGRLFKP